MISIEKAQEISGIGYWELDFISAELIWSNQVYKIFGVDPSSFTPTEKRFSEFVHPDDKKEIHDLFERAKETGEPYEIQHRIVLEDGSIRHVIEKSGIVFENGLPVKSYGSVQDITKSVEYRRKLEASQNKFMAISNQTTEGITVADLKGNYVFVNPAFCKMSGYSEAELLQMTVFDMKAKNQDHSTFQISKDRMEGKAIRVNLRKKDGTEYFTEIIGDVIDVEGESLVLGTIRDISERVKSEELIKKLNSNLELKVQTRTQQLDATIERLSREVEQRKQIEERLKESLAIKEVLFKEITHRVKNNMQIISSLINLQRSCLDKESSDFLEQIQHRIHSMALIHETLYKTNEFKDIKFDYYLDSLINYIRESYSFESFEIQLEAEGSQLPLDVGTSLGMIVIELVINSIKHAFANSSEKGMVKILFKEVKPKQYLLSIGDNGVGFPIGLDFKQTKSLGLQLVTSLTDQISGNIELSNNKGTQFQITFDTISQ